MILTRQLCNVLHLQLNGRVSPRKCGEDYCKSCELHVTPGQHKRYMKPLTVLPVDLQKPEEAETMYYHVTYVNESIQLIPNLVMRYQSINYM